MGNVNSEDTRGPAQEGGGAGGGGSRVIEQRQEIPSATAGGGWRLVGTLIVAALLLVAPTWIVAEMLRVTRVVGGGQIAWLYAAVLVLVVAGGVWLLFRVLRRGTGAGE